MTSFCFSKFFFVMLSDASTRKAMSAIWEHSEGVRKILSQLQAKVNNINYR